MGARQGETVKSGMTPILAPPVRAMEPIDSL